MKIKTEDLIGPLLDWAVAKAAGMRYVHLRKGKCFAAATNNRDKAGLFKPSTNVYDGMKIIERERIALASPHDDAPQDRMWQAWSQHNQGQWGPTPLIAAMRCFVNSRLGTEVEITE